MKITGKMQIDIFHRYHLGIAATRCPALHPETWAQRRLSQAHHRLFADSVKPVAQTNSCCGFAFACRGRVNRGDQNQIGCITFGLALQPVKVNFRLVMAIGFQGALSGIERPSANFLNRSGWLLWQYQYLIFYPLPFG